MLPTAIVKTVAAASIGASLVFGWGCAQASVDAQGSCSATNAYGVSTCVEVVGTQRDPAAGQVRYEPGTEVMYEVGDAPNGAGFALRADYGNLGVRAIARSEASELPLRQDGVGPNAAAVASTSTFFDDSIMVSSRTLPLGAPVTLALTYRLAGTSFSDAATTTVYATASGSASIESSVWVYGAAHGRAVGGTLCDVVGDDDRLGCADLHDGTREVHLDVPTAVGATLQIVGTLQARVTTGASVALHCECAAFPSAHVDAFNSAHFYLDALSPEVQLASASMHDYALPVPEPSTAYLFALGSFFVGVVRAVKLASGRHQRRGTAGRWNTVQR